MQESTTTHSVSTIDASSVIQMLDPWAMQESRLREWTRQASTTPVVRPETTGSAIAGLDLTRDLLSTHTRSDGRRVSRIAVEGPLFRQPNIFTYLGLATDYESVYSSVSRAVNDNTDAILLHIDSPGGEAMGIQELTGFIRDAAAEKPVWSHISGHGLSGGYWLALSGGRVTASESSYVGSIGAIVVAYDVSRALGEMGIDRYVFVSADSPAKHNDLQDEEARARIQSRIDDIGKKFLNWVAERRYTDADDVRENYGRGDVVSAPIAQNRGMIDAVVTIDAALEAPMEGIMTRTETDKDRERDEESQEEEEQETENDEETENGDDEASASSLESAFPQTVARIRADARSQERDRIAALEQVGSHMGASREAILDAISNESMSADKFAVHIAQTAPEGQRVNSQLDADASEFETPEPGEPTTDADALSEYGVQHARQLAGMK